MTPLKRDRSRTGRRLLAWLLACYGFALVIVLHTPATEWLAQSLYLPLITPPTADAIVVLEAWASDDGELNESGLKRAVRAGELYRDGRAGTVVVTGSNASSRDSSALEPMTRVLLLTGVPREAIVIEGTSTNTHESAVRVAALAIQRDWTRIILVTDAAHMRRATLSFRKEGVTVAHAPVLVWNLGAAQPSMRLSRLGTLVHECVGLAYYWFNGWI